MYETRNNIFLGNNLNAIDASFYTFWESSVITDEGWLSHAGISKKKTRNEIALREYEFKSRWVSSVIRGSETIRTCIFRFRQLAGNHIDIEISLFTYSENDPEDLRSFHPIASREFWLDLYSEFLEKLKREGFDDIQQVDTDKGEEKIRSKYKQRAELFKQIKVKHPLYSQSTVAAVAKRKELNSIKTSLKEKYPDKDEKNLDISARAYFKDKWNREDFLAYNVRYAYKKYGWTWNRGERNR